MTDTPNLGLPFIEGSQAQKHVTHNEALRILDAAIQISVLDLTRTAPPSNVITARRSEESICISTNFKASPKALNWSPGCIVDISKYRASRRWLR